MRGGTLLVCLIVLSSFIASASAGPAAQITDRVQASEPTLAQDDPLPWPWTQDDAGSGQDAPHFPVPEVLIDPGVVYEGTLAGVGFGADSRDHYAFWGEAGDVVRAKTRGLLACYEITDEDGKRVGTTAHCTLVGWDAATADVPEEVTRLLVGPPIEVVLEHTGIHYFHLYGYTLQQYRFSIGINEEAPEPGYNGGLLPPPPPGLPL